MKFCSECGSEVRLQRVSHEQRQRHVCASCGTAPMRRSHFVWNEGRVWGDKPAETYLDSLARHLKSKPDEVFLDFEGHTSSYRDLDIRSRRMANALAKLGVGKGDTVVTVLDNSEDQVLTLFAVNWIGVIWVPINTAFRGEFLRHPIADAGASLVICERHYLQNVLQIAARLPRLAQVVVRNGDAGAISNNLTVTSLDAVRGGDEADINHTVRPDDISCLIYTSGTSGPAKGCMISHNYLCSIGRRRNQSVVPAPGEVTWSCLPLFLIASLGALLIANLLAGERTAIASRFSVSAFWEEIERSGATSAIILASMFSLLAQAPDTPATLRCRKQLRVVTGIPVSAADRKIWHDRFGVAYMNTYAYGQTEANLVSLLPWGAPLPPMDSMGPPSEDFDVMVADNDRRPVPIGAVGELLVRPRQPGVMFSGYWGRPQDTLDAMKDAWWHTGDFVRMDEQGYLYFVDRKKDYLRSRGENISSFEVESAMMTHPAVAEVAFHTVSGEAGVEEEIKATVVLRSAGAVSEQELFEWAQQNLPYFAVPRFVELRPELPKTPTGKVQKHELRVQGRTDGTWDAYAAGFEIRRGRAAGAPR
jgi:crotonobetaine/carnitine-CoA ligase